MAATDKPIIRELREHVTPAVHTALALGLLLFLDDVVPETNNRLLTLCRGAIGLLLAAYGAHLVLALFRPRPLLQLVWDYLPVGGAPYGQRVETETFEARRDHGGSVWFRVSLYYKAFGPIARWVGKGLDVSGSALELELRPAHGLTVSIEHPDGAEVVPLRMGRRGALVPMPVSIHTGQRACAFELEIRMPGTPVPVPRTATVRFAQTSQGLRRHRAVKLESALKTLVVR